MNKPKKPVQLRIVFILNALMMVLPFVFYQVITSKEIVIGGLEPMWMIYTGIAYILSFALLVYSILKQRMGLFRSIFVLNVLIAMPAKAWIGVGVAVISMALSFHAKIKAYFNAK